MPSKPRIYFAGSVLILTSVIVLTVPWTFGFTKAESAPTMENVSGNSAAHPALPQYQSLTPIAVVTVTVQGATLGQMVIYDDAKTERRGVRGGQMVIYDDAKTERRGDFAAIHTRSGHLVGLTWFDRFGIQRTAVDRGLLEADEPQGVLLLF
jgi:hypothetical protein